jgi:hypothetical protein
MNLLGGRIHPGHQIIDNEANHNDDYGSQRVGDFAGHASSRVQPIVEWHMQRVHSCCTNSGSKERN